MAIYEMQKLHDFLGDELFDVVCNEYYLCGGDDFYSFMKKVPANMFFAEAFIWSVTEQGSYYWDATDGAWLEYLGDELLDVP